MREVAKNEAGQVQDKESGQSFPSNLVQPVPSTSKEVNIETGIDDRQRVRRATTFRPLLARAKAKTRRKGGILLSTFKRFLQEAPQYENMLAKLKISKVRGPSVFVETFPRDLRIRRAGNRTFVEAI